MIVYGTGSFAIKRFNPADLGINELNVPGHTIEYRQKYGHLFWIPFFGIGKMWALRKPDNNLYIIPGDIEARIVAMNKPLKSPWYTYTLCWLMLLAFVIALFAAQ